MFGDKQRHKEVIEELEQTRYCCEDLATEVYELKETLRGIDIQHIVSIMEQFIKSTAYIKHVLESAEVCDHDHDSCFNLNGE